MNKSKNAENMKVAYRALEKDYKDARKDWRIVFQIKRISDEWYKQSE